jgi:8-oxo-dGTP pyrophosphatase MutT (NUDIX family)
VRRVSDPAQASGGAAPGLQVPAGTLRQGEDPAAGALREAQEETGLAGLRLVRFLGSYEWDQGTFLDRARSRRADSNLPGS